MQTSGSIVRALALGLITVLAGCGGGGDGGTASAPSVPGMPGPPGSGGGNTPPTIQGQPASSVMVGQAYSFQPSASDGNGDALTFSVANLPRWASFNASTGRISGTPASGDVGTYSGIAITVSDGTASASLGPFSIAVVASASGAATLTWTPPTQNTDGSSLTDLAGYQVIYGRSADNLNQSVAINNPGLSTYMIENLTAGTWFFAVLAVNSAGATSELSNVASKTIS